MRQVIVFQRNEFGCGYACVKMALCHASRDKRFAYLKEPLPEKAPSLLEIVSFGKSLGLEMIAYSKKYLDLETDNITFPFIAMLKSDGSYGNHLVFVLKKRKNKVTIIDPQKGKITMPFALLEARYAGVILVFGEYQDLRIALDRPKDKAEKSIFPIPFLLTLSPLIFLGAGFLLASFNAPFPFTIIAFSLYVLFIILERLSISRLSHSFDDSFKNVFIHSSPEKRKRDYIRYQHFKAKDLTFVPNLASSFLQLVITSIFFVIGNYYLSVAMGVILLLRMIDSLLIYPKIKAESYTIEVLERRFFSKDLADDDIRSSYRNLLTKAEKLERFVFAKEVIITFIGVCAASLCSLLEGRTELVSLLYCFSGVVLFSKQLSDCIGFLHKYPQYKAEKAFFSGMNDKANGKKEANMVD